MNRVDLQYAIADAIEKARTAVKSRKGLRAAMRVGAYRIGNRIFACLDGENAVEIKGDQVFDVPAADFGKYVRPENDLTMSYEFNGISIDTLNGLSRLFREVAAD